MHTPHLKQLTDDFLAQQRIAVAGVSRSGQSPANLIYRKLKATGHTVYALNPNAEMVEGDKAYPNVAAVPDGLDGVVIVTPAAVTEQIVRECHTAGVKRVWIHESLLVHGTSMSHSAAQYARDHDMTVIAGGCPMMFLQPDIFHAGMRWFMQRTGKLPA
jgi:predicted CoA-binding protein